MLFRGSTNREEAMHFFWFILIGLAAGWLAGKVMRGGGFGVVGDIIVGVIGALLGGFLFRALGFFPREDFSRALLWQRPVPSYCSFCSGLSRDCNRQKKMWTNDIIEVKRSMP
jgi:uncharacterized membrane protein YeaQ/YmgE (transglycosylase-associated protein family)